MNCNDILSMIEKFTIEIDIQSDENYGYFLKKFIDWKISYFYDIIVIFDQVDCKFKTMEEKIRYLGINYCLHIFIINVLSKSYNRWRSSYNW